MKHQMKIFLLLFNLKEADIDSELKKINQARKTLDLDTAALEQEREQFHKEKDEWNNSRSMEISVVLKESNPYPNISEITTPRAQPSEENIGESFDSTLKGLTAGELKETKKRKARNHETRKENDQIQTRKRTRQQEESQMQRK